MTAMILYIYDHSSLLFLLNATLLILTNDYLSAISLKIG